MNTGPAAGCRTFGHFVVNVRSGASRDGCRYSVVGRVDVREVLPTTSCLRRWNHPAPTEVHTVITERVGTATIAGSDVALTAVTVQDWTEALRNRDLGSRVNDALSQAARTLREGRTPGGATPATCL